jgi:sugar phosphate isomerase/epimerase
MKIYMHVNFLETIFPLEEVARRAAAAGYDGIELRGWDRTAKTPLAEYLKRCCGIAESNKLDLVFGCKNVGYSAGKAQWDKAMEELQTVIRVGAEHGVKILNVFGEPLISDKIPYSHFEEIGSGMATEAVKKATADYFRQAGDFAAKHDVALCFEMHNGYLHDLAAPTLELLKAIDHKNVKANIDFGNIVLNRNNQGMEKELDLMAGRIGYVHLKNVITLNRFDSRIFRCVALRDGEINTFLFMRKLLENGYSGPVCIENTFPGDKREFVKEDLEYLRRIVAELRK